MIKLVICDIDSTLVNSQRELLPYTKEVLEKLHAKGIYFGIASGRPLDELMRYAKEWDLSFEFDVVIGMNGSEVWDGIHQKEYSFYKLKKEWIQEILELMSVFETNPFIYYHGVLLAYKNDAMMQKSARSSKKEVHVVKSIEELYQEDNAKIMFRMKEELMPEVEAYLAKHTSPNYIAFKTQSTLMEFADHRISKAYALEKLCEVNDFSLEEVMAFGDTTNDNTMLEASGHGVCMINGSDDTKAIADAITEYSCQEDGVARYLENWNWD